MAVEQLLERVIDCGGPFDIVLACLDVRSLLNLTMCRKKFLQQLRYEHVFRSSLCDDIESWLLISQVDLIEKRAIWVPTPLRMLRLASVLLYNCEFCVSRDIFACNLGFGVLMCTLNNNAHGCAREYTKEIPDSGWSKPTDDRILASGGHLRRTLIWDGQQHVRDASGNFCGPYLTYSEWQKPDCEDLYNQRVAADPNARFTKEILTMFTQCKEERLKGIDGFF